MEKEEDEVIRRGKRAWEEKGREEQEAEEMVEEKSRRGREGGRRRMLGWSIRRKRRMLGRGRGGDGEVG